MLIVHQGYIPQDDLDPTSMVTEPLGAIGVWVLQVLQFAILLMCIVLRGKFSSQMDTLDRITKGIILVILLKSY